MANEQVYYSALHWAKKAEASAKLAAELAQTEGEVIQLGFDGTMEDGKLVFKHAPAGVAVPYQLVANVEYEIDLAYNETGDLPNLTEIVVENGNDIISFVSALHRSSTEPARVADMDAVMRYDATTGYRWLFKATFKITPNGAKVFLLYPVVTAKDYSDKTNCITEIPQDIKLELKDGTLTLKAGSKVYVPNGKDSSGNNVFDEIVIESDLTTTDTGNRILWFSYNFAANKLYAGISPETGAPVSGTYKVYYDPGENKCFVSNASGYVQTSFPICIIKSSTTGITSIDQVFNGFGYIGSTVFALPGVKGLIPNGRNSDGSLKNTEFTVSNVISRTFTTQNVRYGDLGINPSMNPIIGASDSVSYDENLNMVIEKDDNWNRCFFGKGALASGRISNLSIKTVFNTVDRNDSSWIAQQAMPSGKYINLTLGSSGSTYTAPANGYFVLNKVSTAAKQYVTLHVKDDNGNDLLSYQLSATAENHFLGFCQPVMKGHRLVLTYKIDGTTYFFRFIYCEGEN